MSEVVYEKWSIDRLNEDENNPRVITKTAQKALRASLKKFGLVQPIIVNRRTGKVVGGHQRLTVLRLDGATEVDVAIGDWSEAEERALNVTLNNQAAQGKFQNVAEYLGGAQDLGLAAFKELKLDVLAFDDPREMKTLVKERPLEYKLVITCKDELHQAELLDKLERAQLEVKVLIV